MTCIRIFLTNFEEFGDVLKYHYLLKLKLKRMSKICMCSLLIRYAAHRSHLYAASYVLNLVHCTHPLNGFDKS